MSFLGVEFEGRLKLRKHNQLSNGDQIWVQWYRRSWHVYISQDILLFVICVDTYNIIPDFYAARAGRIQSVRL